MEGDGWGFVGKNLHDMTEKGRSRKIPKKRLPYRMNPRRWMGRFIDG